MRKIGIQFLIFLLVFSTFPANYNAVPYAEKLEREDNVILLAEEVDGKIDLLDVDSLEVVYEIEDDSEALFIETVDEEFVLIQLTIINEEDKEIVMEGIVHTETVFDEEEADEYREAREAIEEDESLLEELEEEVDETDKNLSEESTEDNEIKVEEDTAKESNEEEVNSASEETDIESNISTFSSLARSLPVKESATSRLGHIRNRDVNIYKELGGSSFKAGNTYTNAVYYIKRQAIVGSEIYYLLSTSPSSIKGVVGWAKASDLSTHAHVGVDKQRKSFLIKGNGKATTKAWGGSKDTVYGNLNKYKNEVFNVHLTEKVGRNTWYRGNLDGQTVWLHSSYLMDADVSKTSRLGHIRSGNVDIYESLGGSSFKAGSTYTNAVYYIKSEANFKNKKYYLLSTSPSSTKGVIGWAKASDLSTHAHVGVDKKQKTFYIKGTGKATTKAWGGSKDTVYPNLSNYKNRAFEVNLTEKVGNNTWYRGMLGGKQVWVHSSYVYSPSLTATSRLGHIRSGNVDLYKTLGGDSFKAGSTHTNAVYYIKQQAVFGSDKQAETYYLLSTSPSATKGVLGWAKASDLSTHTHVGVDKRSKTFVIKGNGKAYSKAWGGNKDLTHANMTSYEGEILYVNLTEKVGNNTWYRGKINNEGPTIWLHASYLTTTHTTYTNYVTSFNEALNTQMNKSPQTDKYRNLPAYVHKDYLEQVKGNSYKVNATTLNVRENPSTNSHIWGQLKRDDIVTVVNESGNWFEIKYGSWRNAKSQDVSQYLNPALNDIYQHLVLSQSVGVPASELNKVLSGKGVLDGLGQAFINGAKKHSVNEIYLISHALLESGHGTSELARGVEVGKDRNGKLVLKTEENKNDLTAIKTTYNMFGIGAVDADPLRAGAIRAYEEGWFTPANAIVGGTKFIGERYIHNQYKQNTLYKMRWNPANPGYPQYATDIGWAVKQTNNIKSMYNQLENPVLSFDIPKYR